MRKSENLSIVGKSCVLPSQVCSTSPYNILLLAPASAPMPHKNETSTSIKVIFYVICFLIKCHEPDCTKIWAGQVFAMLQVSEQHHADLIAIEVGDMFSFQSQQQLTGRSEGLSPKLT